MKILIISPGKAHSPELRDAIAEYETRLRSALPVEWAFPSISDKDGESVAILKLIKTDDVVVLLDERGKEINSPGLAELLEGNLNVSTKRLVFVIGGAFGVSDAVIARADRTLKLSSLVFPHMLVRLILIEQLYRAWSIRTGGKYHHV
ncbi:MAG TPA: 23S rRNA (pseudouridine(1915)-N(3))-methyltransferase RlmH [Candidatus Paceibacterota bacterium]|nr:23S rRNA (pseudouridine(1915)-N(3))-methyltransferase RlmH [Candidatus Paceibacterota bacterium]